MGHCQRLIYAIFILAITCASAFSQSINGLLRQPDISKSSVVFVYGGDIWLVPKSGGIARRLTGNPSIKRYPKFSPDGKWIAFTGNYDGNDDVYVIPAEGGEPKRLTYHPDVDLVTGWTPDSKSVLFRSPRFSAPRRFTRLFTVPLTGGPEKELPLPEASLASYSQDGGKLAYTRLSRENATWKRYRGGEQAYVSIYDMTTNAYSELPHTDVTDFYPMWHGDKIYFASDRTNTINLFCYDLKSKSTRQLTRYTDYDVKWPSLGPDAIVFENGGVMKYLDLFSDKVTTVPAQVLSDLPAVRSTVRRVEGEISAYDISPSGARAVLSAHGEIFTAPAKKGDSRDLTNSPGVREINGSWSPDGKYIAYLSDKSGEYEVYIRPQDGSGEETRLTNDGSVYRYGPGWSPDSKWLLYSDAAMRIWMVSLADKKPIQIDSSDQSRISGASISPDSKWIVYTKMGKNGLSGLWLYSVDKKSTRQISDYRFDDQDPVFDLGGRYIFFRSARNFTPSLIGPELGINFQNTEGIYALLLQADAASPFAPESDEEKPKEEPKPADAKPADAKPADAKPAGPPSAAASTKPDAPKPPAGPSPVKIDLDGLYSRIVPLPIPAGNFSRLEGGNNKLLYMSGGAVHQYDLGGKADAVIISGVGGYAINPAASKLIYSSAAGYGIVDVAPGQAAGAGKLNLALEMKTDPRAEWKEVFRDAWRVERDFFYDPSMKGMDWKAIGDRYEKLVPSIAHRDDLTYLLGELLGELNTSHAYVQAADTSGAARIGVGLLGADFEVSQGLYRIKKIYAGDNWDPSRKSPLAEPGVKVKEGDYILAVNGAPLKAETNVYAPFEGTVGKTVTIKVNDKPNETGAHDIQVRPVASEANIRYADWVEGNRKKVEIATGGRVGYFHVPDTSFPGISEFGKSFYALSDKEALIVDERYNGGGFIPTFFVEKLGRKLQSKFTPRYGADRANPGEAVYGPKVILANEYAGSGGDAFPYYFRKYGVGPIIGRRTWGGLVGISGSYGLMDGGTVTIPQFGIWSHDEKKWIAENHGVDPDMDVLNSPDLTSKGLDPQLDRAISYIMDELKKHPAARYQHPPFPVEKR